MRNKNGTAILLLLGLSVFARGESLGSVPSSGGQDWSAWKYRLPIKLAGLTGAGAAALPIDVTFTLKAAECPNPEREIRLIYRGADGRDREVPFQLSRLRVWNKGLDPKIGESTLNGVVTFFDVPGGGSSGTYFLLHGNPAAQAPSYPTDLAVSGQWPDWIVENRRIEVRFRKGDPVKPGILHDVFGDSGQISAVTLKSRPKAPISNKDRTLHWNPGVLVPERGWSNAHAWDPPEKHELEKGPVFVEIRRSGPLPLVPEVELAITYRIFSGRDYVWYGATLRAREDIGIVSLRTNEIVFDEGFFSRLAWEAEGRTQDRPLDEFHAANKHGDILRLPADVPFLAAYDPARGVGTATVNLDYSVVDPLGGVPARYDHAFFAVKGVAPVGSGGLFFWFRSFFNFAPEWDRRQRFILPAGWTCSEQSLFQFFEAGGAEPVKAVESLSRAVRDLEKLDIQVGPHPFAPSNRQANIIRR